MLEPTYKDYQESVLIIAKLSLANRLNKGEHCLDGVWVRSQKGREVKGPYSPGGLELG